MDICPKKSIVFTKDGFIDILAAPIVRMILGGWAEVLVLFDQKPIVIACTFIYKDLRFSRKK